MAGASWTFLTNHTRVLLCLADEPDLRLREAAERIGITERAVQRIVTDLEDAGVITRTREGRRNTYAIHEEARLRHLSNAHVTVGELLELLKL